MMECTINCGYEHITSMITKLCYFQTIVLEIIVIIAMDKTLNLCMLVKSEHQGCCPC